MSTWEFNLDEAAANENSVGGGKVETGMHPVKITGVFPSTDNGGNNRVDITFEGESAKGVIFGIAIDKTFKSGKDNPNYATWMEFAKVAGMKTGAIKQAPRKMRGEDIQADSFAEPLGKEMILALYIEHDFYNNEEKDKLQLAKTFTKSKKSVVEAVQKVDADELKDYKLTEEKLKDSFSKNWKNRFGEGAEATTTTEGAETTEDGKDDELDELFN